VSSSAAKDLLFARVASKADPSLAQNRRDLRMTLLRVFQQPAKGSARGAHVCAERIRVIIFIFFRPASFCIDAFRPLVHD
jgi:hypothetical protein